MIASLVDLAVNFGEAGRRLAGDAPTFWVARHMQGPLGAFALIAPVAYALDALVSVLRLAVSQQAAGIGACTVLDSQAVEEDQWRRSTGHSAVRGGGGGAC